MSRGRDSLSHPGSAVCHLRGAILTSNLLRSLHLACLTLNGDMCPIAIRVLHGGWRTRRACGALVGRGGSHGNAARVIAHAGIVRHGDSQER